MAKVDEKQLSAMRKLGFSDIEIQQMLADDKRIDRGEQMEWDLPLEEHKKAMKYANSDEKKPKNPENGAKTPKKRKENTEKAQIIADIYAMLMENGYENVEIVNKEKLIHLTIGENRFEIDLKQKRK